MKTSPIPILALLLVVVGGGFLVWTGGGAGDVTPYAPAAWLEDDLEAAEPIDLAAIDAIDEPAASDDEMPEELARIALEQSPAPASARLLVVQVWDRKKGVPAAEADVFVLDGFDGPELKDPFAQHWSELAESRGQRFATDGEGRVELPPVRSSAMVTARRSGAYGFTRIGRRHRAVETITLQADETVTVRVVDGEDRGVAGVPVGVVQRVPLRADPGAWIAQLRQIKGQKARVEAYVRDNPAEREAAMGRLRALQQREARLTAGVRKVQAADKLSKLRGAASRPANTQPPLRTRNELRARRRTRADGIAVFRHFQVYRHEREKWWPAEHADQFEAVLLMPLQQPESRAFAGRPVPSETLELFLPPTGSLALRTIDRDGRPFTHPVHAEIRVQDTKAGVWTRAQHRKEQNEETIEFPFVGLGLRFTAHCRLDDDDFRWDLPLFAGPSSPGERVTVDLVVALGEGMLFGRLLDGAGEPLAGVRPQFLINTSAGRLEGEDVTVDLAGRFHLPYQVRPQHRGPFRLEIRRNDVIPTAGLAMRLATLPAGRVTDLGDLRIDGFGEIAHGFVVDDLGQPIAGATVQLQRERDVGKDRPRFEFVDEAFTVSQTDDGGGYALFGELEPGRYRLRAQARDHFPVGSPELRRGEQLDLTLQRNSKLVGTVLTPSWMSLRSLRVRLESAVDPRQKREDKVRAFKGKKFVYFDRVVPGTYNLLIRVLDFPDPFVRIDGIRILPGQQGLHPRLQDLDLGAFVYRFEVAAVDERGQPIKPSGPLLARIGRPDGSTAFVGFTWRANRAEILSASPQLEVWPLSAGYRAEHTVLGQGRSELQFLRIPPLELQVPGLRQLIGTTPAWISMVSIGSSDGLPNRLETWDPRSNKISGWFAKASNAGRPLRNGDSVRMPLMRDGRYRVVAHLGRKSESVRLVPVELGPVDVRLVPGAGPQRATAAVDPALVRAALDELARRTAASGR